jgi:hypothetical protein
LSNSSASDNPSADGASSKKYESFYFRGANNELNLRAQNLMVFLQAADGIDGATWMHHLKRGDYSTWFRDIIKDRGLADEAAVIEADDLLDAEQSREKIAAVVTSRYAAPVDYDH